MKMIITEKQNQTVLYDYDFENHNPWLKWEIIYKSLKIFFLVNVKYVIFNIHYVLCNTNM